MHRVSGDMEASGVLPESAVLSPPRCRCVGVPQSSYNGIETISWDFTTNVDAMFAADTLFQTLIDNLTNAAKDAYAARRIMGGQAAACVPLARGDLSRIENSALDIATLVKSLRSTLSTYAWSMKKIRDDFRSITPDAQKASLAVSTCGESAFIHLEDSQRASLQPLFDSLAQRCSWEKTAMERANYEFSTDLAKIDTSFVEQLLLDLVKRFKDKFIPPRGHNAAFNMPKYLQGLVSEGAKTVHGIYLYAEHASFSPGEQFKNAPKIGRFLLRGEFENWKPQRGRHAKITIETPLEPLPRSGATGTAEVAVTTSTLPKSVTLIEKGAKIGGGAIAILGGGITAYESYQSDTYHHPEMGEGTKIARAGIKGSISAVGGWGGAFFGAKIGAAVGASLGPLGIVAGSIIGGIIGGSLAGSASDLLASDINDSILNS